MVGVRRSGAAAENFDEMRNPAEVEELLSKCDWLVIACPLSEQTRSLVDAALLAKLPPTARLINIARGEIVDERALVSALESGRLAGAYLDVFAQEPLPQDSPLWTMPNVLVTPHNSSASKGNEARVNAIFLDNLKRWHRNEPLVNEVTSI